MYELHAGRQTHTLTHCVSAGSRTDSVTDLPCCHFCHSHLQWGSSGNKRSRIGMQRQKKYEREKTVTLKARGGGGGGGGGVLAMFLSQDHLQHYWISVMAHFSVVYLRLLPLDAPQDVPHSEAHSTSEWTELKKFSESEMKEATVRGLTFSTLIHSALHLPLSGYVLPKQDGNITSHWCQCIFETKWATFTLLHYTFFRLFIMFLYWLNKI